MCFPAGEDTKKRRVPVNPQSTTQHAAASLEVEKLQKGADDTGIRWPYSSNTWEFRARGYMVFAALGDGCCRAFADTLLT